MSAACSWRTRVRMRGRGRLGWQDHGTIRRQRAAKCPAPAWRPGKARLGPVGRPARARTRAGRCKGPPNAAASGRFARSLHSSSRGGAGPGWHSHGGTASGRVLGVTQWHHNTAPRAGGRPPCPFMLPGGPAARTNPRLSLVRSLWRNGQLPGEPQYRRAWRPPPGRTLAPRPMHPRARLGR